MTDVPMPQTTAEWAKAYMDRGWAPIPLKFQDKNPVHSGWQRLEIRPDDIDDQFTDDRNIGLNLGPASKNLVDIDLDDVSSVMLAPHFLPVTGTVFGRLSKPNSHFLYEADPEDTIRRVMFQDPDGAMLLEIRGGGHQTMVPSSTHPHGERLEWTVFDDPGAVRIDALQKRAGWLASAAMLGRHWGEWDHRHHMIVLSLTGGLLRAGHTPNVILNFVKAVCHVGNDDDWADREKAIQSTVDKVEAGEDVVGWPRLTETIGEDYVRKLFAWLNIQTAADEIPATDHGNALRLARDFGDVLRFVPDWNHWAIWDSTRWNPDKAERVFSYARQISGKVTEEAAKTQNDDRRTALHKWAMKSQDVARLNAILRIGKTDDAFIVDSNDLDKDPWLFNVQNGTIDLRTGGLRQHDPKDLLSKKSNIVYDPDATCPRWEAYLEDVQDGNQNIIAFLKRLIGYSMTGLTTEQVFTLMWGPPGTGKTTFIETVRNVFGDYATHAEASTFMAKQKSGRATPELTRLQGARLVTSTETEEGQRMALALVKQLSGGDRMTAANLYAAPFEFDPVLKLWIATNHKPRIPADEEAIWERLAFVPFTVQFRNRPNQVKDLREILASEYPGILRWAVEGCLEWRRDGLNRPAEVLAAQAEYKNESDEIGDFLAEMTDTDPTGSVSASQMYNAYREWAADRGFRPVNIRRFKEKMEGRGYKQVRKASGQSWEGLTLNETISVVTDFKQNKTDARTTFGRPS